MVSGLKGAVYEERLKELGLTTLEERRHQADMLQTFKIVRGIDKVNSETWFQMAAHAEGYQELRRTAQSKAETCQVGGKKELFLQQSCGELEPGTK